MNFIRHIFTGKDNQTWDMGRVSWAISMLAVVGHDAWQLAKGAHADIKDFAIALGAVVAAHGFALGMKAKTEPQGEPQ